MKKQSAGILAYKYDSILEVFLVHPGGPFYKLKDEGVWSIPKGEYTDDEIPLEVAKREFHEETGNVIKEENFIPLKDVTLKSGKRISAWAININSELSFINSNTFDIEWPPKSGKIVSFPEVDKAEWFSIEVAKTKIHPAQVDFLKCLENILN